MDYSIGSIKKTETGTVLMTVYGGFPEDEDDERGAFPSLKQDLEDFNSLARPYLDIDKGPECCDGYTQDLTYSIEVKQTAYSMPEWNVDKAEASHITKVLHNAITVFVVAAVHESCSKERKVLMLTARYCTEEIEELAEMVHFLARKGFTVKEA